VFFGDWLQRRETLSPNKVALIDAINDNQPITYREWNQRANQLANFLRDGLGIGKGDRVSIYALNRVDYLDALFACNKLGAILHVNNWRLKPRELEPLINDAAPRVFIYSQEFAAQVNELRSRLSSVERFIGLDQVTRDQDTHWLTERGNWPQTQPPPVELDWEDPWIICYTGGTTGLPKGAILHTAPSPLVRSIPSSVGDCAPTTQSASTRPSFIPVDSTSSPRRWSTWAAQASSAPASTLTNSSTRSRM